MKQVAVTQLKNRLSEFLRLVKRGETIDVLEHGIPIARLSPLVGKEKRSEDLLDRAIREGIARPGRGRLPADFFDKHPPIPCNVDAVQMVIESRGDR